MSIKIRRGHSDPVIEEIISALKIFEADHPNARIELYRRDRFSVLIRMIDEDFSSQNRAERNHNVWKYFDLLSEETQSDISSLILLTPEETSTSISSIDFGRESDLDDLPGAGGLPDSNHPYLADSDEEPKDAPKPWRDHIIADPAILAGKPVIKGTRLTVEFILELLAEGWTHDRIEQYYPVLSEADIQAALLYAVDVLKREGFHSLAV